MKSRKNLARMERMEQRVLLAAQLAVNISDGTSFNSSNAPAPSGSPLRTDFGTLAEGSDGSVATKVVRLKNTGDANLTITSIHRLHSGNASWFNFAQVSGNQFPAPDTVETITASNIVLIPSGSYFFKIEFPKDTPIEFQSSSSNFIEIRSNAASTPIYNFFVFGQVVKQSVTSAKFPNFSNNVFSDTGTVSARRFQDGDPDRVVQSDDAAMFFTLTQKSKITMTLGGGLDPNAFEPSDECKLKYVLTKDNTPTGQLSAAERVAGTQYFTGDIRTGGTISPTPVTLAAGKWILHVSVLRIPPTNTGNPPYPLLYNLTVRRESVPLPRIDVVGVTNGDTSPATSDGTAFAPIANDPPPLTFTARNSGVDKLKATVSVDGDFEVVNGISPDGIDANNTDQITIQLKSDRTAPGTKAGNVVIHATEPGVADFTFAVGGTITDPPVDPPNFAVVTGNTLTVTGTGANDTLTSTAVGSTFSFTLNGSQSANFSTTAIGKIIVNLLDGNDSYSSSTQLDVKQTINGGNGDDLIRAGKQADLMNGGDGNDRMDGRSRGDTFNGEGGSDTAIYRQRHEDVTVTIDELPHDGGGTDQFKDNVLSSTEHIQGGLGNDHLTGSSKTNRLFGFEGNDVIAGLKGNDLLDGGSGINNLNGGFGNDQLFSRNTFADVIDGGTDANGLDIDTLTGDLTDTVSNVETPNLA